MHIEYESSKRGYRVELVRDLLGDFVLVRRWYGLFNKRHGGKMQVFLQETEALDAVDKIDRARLRRGYVRKTVLLGGGD
ncbi:WGR domain-containing protein [Extensimonas sp. H3M7-6]|uniref:WGR domain-containing protein n=1 Tax=Extensimonas soli TaxID=3031322 RepID=UPI0023DC6C2F|nr:WGR domain-containing protein [Extensimonas sp. H3M7-6]MDF1482161.1 WGR domain-containing protein [Extensimonas sp. H3M7-6]